MNKSVSIRAAQLSDAAEIAHVHIATWRSTYEGIVPKAYLDGLNSEKRVQQWQRMLTQVEPQNATLVATRLRDDGLGEQVIGFVSTGPNRAPNLKSDGELFAIYLLKEHQKKGTGKRLFEAGKNQLRQDGFTSIVLWVLADSPTVQWYEAMGGQRVGEKTEEVGGKPLKEWAYFWPNTRVNGPKTQ